MSRFIESIRLEHGFFPMLDQHQRRINRTLSQLGNNTPFILKNALKVPKTAQQGIYKCRVVYDTSGIHNIEFIPYTIKLLNSFSLTDIGGHTYTFKSEERAWIYDLLDSSPTEEIIMCKDSRITDSSYANLCFFNGKSWATPKHPLLQGTRRQQLLEEKILTEVAIRIKDLEKFTHFKCINAMMTWEESPLYSIDLIQ